MSRNKFLRATSLVLCEAEENHRLQLKDEVSKIPGVVEAYAITGKFDVCALITAANTQGIGRIVHEISLAEHIKFNPLSFCVYNQPEKPIVAGFPETGINAFVFIDINKGVTFSFLEKLRQIEGVHGAEAIGGMYQIYLKINVPSGTFIGKEMIPLIHTSNREARESNICFVV